MFVAVSFVGNGMCSVVQKAQQVTFDGKMKNEFMIIALLIAVAVLFTASLVKEKKDIPNCLKNGWYLCAATGLFNGMVNLFVMILAGMMQVSVMFPLISAGGIITTFIMSRFTFRESFSRSQLFGFIFGVAAVVLLNL